MNIDIRHACGILGRIGQIQENTERKTRGRGINNLQIADFGMEPGADFPIVTAVARGDG